VIQVYTLKIEQSLEAEFDYLQTLNISESRKKTLDKTRNNSNKCIRILTELLLFYSIRDSFGVSFEQLEIQKNPYGKPYCSNYDFIHYNLSHSNEWIVCAVSSSEVGIDVQVIVEFGLNIAKRFFSKDEYKYLSNCSKECRNRMFTKLWTLKESYVKLIGTGLSFPIHSFIINDNNEMDLIDNKGKDDKYIFTTYELDSEHILSVCTIEKNPITIKNLSIELLKRSIYTGQN
jgi:Phosphopantetheinyl transferase